MLKRKVSWVLSTAVVCAGLWLSLSPQVSDAAGGGKNYQVSIVDADGKSISGAHVVFLRPGGKPYDAIMVDKGTWVVKNADEKVSVSVRNGRSGGVIELPGGTDDLSIFSVTVSSNGLAVKANDSVAVPSGSTKPQIDMNALQRSTRASISDVNRAAAQRSTPSPVATNIPVKSIVQLGIPANDLCADAIPVAIPSVTSGTTTDATLDGVGTCGTTNTAPGVWYSIVGNGTVVTVDTCANTPHDSKLGVFTGTCGGLVCVGGNDDTSGCGGSDSRVTFCATQGVTYYILVHGFQTQSGPFDLTVSSGASCAPPANDLCENALDVGALPATVNVDNSFATNDTLVTCASSPHNKTTWFTVVGDGTTFTASTCNAGTTVADTELIVYCGDCAEPLCVGGDDDSCGAAGELKSVATWCTEPGATYLIAVGNFSSTLVGNIQLDVSSDGVPACQGAVSCLTLTGACCNGGTCTGTTEEADCVGGGGTWYLGESCPAFACPGECAGDTCASAASISSLPFNASGNSCDCADDYDSVCPFTGSTSSDVVYSYTPAADQCVSVSLCNGSDYDTKVYVFANDCTSAAVACNDDDCTSPNFPDPYVSNLDLVTLTGGTTYYFVVDGYGGECGGYVLDIAEVACPQPCGDCPGGAVQENEPDCGLPTDTVNGGCNGTPAGGIDCCSATSCTESQTCADAVCACDSFCCGGSWDSACAGPNPFVPGCSAADLCPECENLGLPFSPMACGQTTCGTAAWDGSSRDTDWYEVVFTDDTEFTWTVQAEFPAVIGMVETSPLGNPDCSTATALDPFAVSGVCGEISVTRCVPPGTYWMFVAPDFNGPTFACGEAYTATLTCVDCEPPTCTGDTCDTAEVIPSVPFSGSGDTCICSDNYDEICPFVAAGSSDKVYSYTPSVDECVDISMCAGSAYDTKVYVYQGSCGAYQSGTFVACNDDECTSPNFGAPYVSELTGVNLLAGQTYYIVVDGYAGECGNYTLDIGPCAPPCDVECSQGATPENELNCGLPEDTVNGGCLNDPPVFTPLTCEQSYCGTAAFDEGIGLRDTDWYQVTVGSATRFTWSANSEFASLTGPVPTSPAGTGNCADVLGVVDPALFGEECVAGQVVTECLPAGTYWFFMAATFDDPVACGKQYEVGLSCEPCVIPLGACCRPDGSCDDDIAEAACENWQGEGTVCTGPNAVSCPQPPGNDLCDDAIAVAIPSVTAGSTQLSTFDTGLPATCGTSITTAGVWYSLTGNGNTITVDTCNGATPYDSKISVFCPNCSAPACVTGNDDSCGLQSSVSFCTAVGETYLILVHGFGGATGPFELTVSDGPACSTPPSCEAVGICGGGGDCCSPGTGPGCNDVACCELVCACDSFCCDVEWDINCAGPNAFVPGCSCLEACEGAEPTGACCLVAGCSIITQSECVAAGGDYLGDDTGCFGPDIPVNSYVDPVAQPIPDGPGGELVDTFEVPDSFTIADLNVDLVVTHTWVGDLVVTIEHNGTSVTIVDRPGYTGTGFGCGEDNLNIVADDEGQGGAIEDQCVPSLTSPPNYVPNNPLSAFDGMDAAGTWTITVVDSEGFDTGSLDQWSLHFGEPGPSACIPSGACCLSPTECIVVETGACNGVYLGDGTDCSAAGPVSVYSASPALAIPDAPASPPGAVGDPLTHTINVPDSFSIADVNVDLDILHTWVGDLIVTVEHNATTVTIVDRAGYAGTGFGCGSDNYDVVIDDQGAGGTIEALCGPTTTPTSPPNYTPNNPLSVFNGMDSAGDWTITITDNANLDTGSLAAWALQITAPGDGPCSGIPFCGNGTIEAGEDCDDGNSDNTDACLNDCTSASCGDGFVQTGVEECDDGNNVNEDSCTNACTLADCGDGFVQPGEQCDDGNGIDTDACTNACTVARCGDGIVRGGFEQCDDGNAVDDDGCTNACTLPICGDGIVQDGEECDGSNAEACDGICLEDCTCEPTAIPTMSEWGLAVLALCLLIGAKLYFGRREVTA